MAEPQYAKLQTEYTVALPQETLSVIVYMNTWVRLKERVRKSRRGVNHWASLLWTAVGVFVTCAIPAYQEYLTARHFSITPWTLFAAVSLVAAIIAFFGLQQSISHETDSIEAILSEMEEIQGRFARPPQ